MSVETMREIQAYGFYIMLIAMVVILYSYWFHLKKSEKQECVCDNKNGNICLTREDPCEIKLHTPEN